MGVLLSTVIEQGDAGHGDKNMVIRIRACRSVVGTEADRCRKGLLLNSKLIECLKSPRKSLVFFPSGIHNACIGPPAVRLPSYTLYCPEDF